MINKKQYYFLLKIICSLTILLHVALICASQITYTSNSVLSSGIIAKIAISKEGIYKIDVPFMQQAGIYTNNLPTNTIQLLGNGGHMLPESNAANRTDDVSSVSIAMFDGGDGIFNGNDYFLFYATGPDKWVADSVQQLFFFEKNLYETNAYYFIKIAGTPSPIITTLPILLNTGGAITTGVEKIALEIDSINLLKSGKSFYGEVLNNITLESSIKTLNLNFKNIPISPIKLQITAAARSINNSCQLQIALNNNIAGSLFFNAVIGGFVSSYATEGFNNFTVSGSQNNALQFKIIGGNTSSVVWHNKTIAQTITTLQMPTTDHLLINSWQNLGINTNAAYQVANSTLNTKIWDISNPTKPIIMPTTFNSGSAVFIQSTNNIKAFIAFEPQHIKQPIFVEKIAPTNLHALTPKPYLIITTLLYKNSAERLQNFHNESHQLPSNIVYVNDIYNEFASGSKDLTAIRDFIKMIYTKGLGTSTPLKYVLLLGDASYVYKSTNNNYVPSWQSTASLDPTLSYVSDDYYGFLNDNEDINNNSFTDNIDVAIGRIPAKDDAEAQQFLDKLIAYEAKESFGEWRTKTTFIADDEDFNLHLNDAEFLIAQNFLNKPLITVKKIYLDAYRQDLNNGSGSYPAVVTQIGNAMTNGNVIWNYSGHGTYNRLTEESVIELPTTANWLTKNKWPIMVTATCDFAPFDNPTELSLGENLLLKKNNGAIAMLTTTRLVFANSNRILNNNYLFYQMQQVNGKYNSIGTSIKLAKNATILTGDPVNARKFICLGDPAMLPAIPTLNIKTTAINNIPFTSIADTLRGLKRVKLNGTVLKANATYTTFNGNINITVYDKKQIAKTLANDAGSIVTNFNTFENIIYRGSFKVINGLFEANFILPQDVNLIEGIGFIKYYAFSNTEDAAGADSVLIGGLSNDIQNDNTPPEITLHINNNKTVNGSKVTNAINLLVNLKDASGINLSTAGVGHEITAQLDNNLDKIILNDSYIQTTSAIPEGNIFYSMGNLSLGKHKITVKAWDIFNNSNTATINFEVIEPAKPQIFELKNYPNPFGNKTTIIAGHNLTTPKINAILTIYNTLGQTLYSSNVTLDNNSQHICAFEYMLPNSFSSYKGLVLYKLILKTVEPNPITIEKAGKMIKY